MLLYEGSDLPDDLSGALTRKQVHSFECWIKCIQIKVDDLGFIVLEDMDFSKFLEEKLNNQRPERDQMDELGHKKSDF